MKVCIAGGCPSIGDVLWCLEMVSNSLEPSSPEMDEEMEDYNDWDSVNSFPGRCYEYDTDADSHSSSFNYDACSDMKWVTDMTNVGQPESTLKLEVA